MQTPTKALRAFILTTDIGFSVYWLISGLHLIPQSLLFKDYNDPILLAWNWSSLPLDLAASGVGIGSLLLARRGCAAWRSLATVSLSLTVCAGLLAISFWTLRSDFDPLWWAPNLFLIFWPFFFFHLLAEQGTPKHFGS